jgi:hypothetical protein
MRYQTCKNAPFGGYPRQRHPTKYYPDCEAILKWSAVPRSGSLVRSREIANSVIYKIMWVGKVKAFLVGRATFLASVFGMANAAPRANANIFTYSRHHELSQGF